MNRPEAKSVPMDADAVTQERVEIGLKGSWGTEAQAAQAPQQIRSEKGEPLPSSAAAEETSQPPTGPTVPVYADQEPEENVPRPSPAESAAVDEAKELSSAASETAKKRSGAAEPEPAGTSAPARVRVVKQATWKLPFFILLAIPLTLAGVLLLLAVAAGIFAVGAALVFFCGSCFLSALTTMQLTQEKLVAIGLALLSLVIALPIFRLMVLVPARGIPALFRAVTALGNRWCYEEVAL